MAAWVVYKNSRNFLTLMYKNLTSNQTFICGELRLDTPTQLILDWVLSQEASQPGDFIKFQDGTVIPVLNPGANQARA